MRVFGFRIQTERQPELKPGSLTRYAFYRYRYNVKSKTLSIALKTASQKRMERKILAPDQLADALKTLDGWSVDGPMLKKRLNFENFVASLEFVNRVGQLAEAADHHPDITLGWGYAELSLMTHDRGGITDVDISLARSIDQLTGSL